jgi:hypothetical protein
MMTAPSSADRGGGGEPERLRRLAQEAFSAGSPKPAAPPRAKVPAKEPKPAPRRQAAGGGGRNAGGWEEF